MGNPEESFTTYETRAPWIVYHYPRPDWLAMIIGGLVIAHCLQCGKTERIFLGWRGVWFPPKDPAFKHPRRTVFIQKHLHGNPIFN